jgi:hypothetical protein
MLGKKNKINQSVAKKFKVQNRAEGYSFACNRDSSSFQFLGKVYVFGGLGEPVHVLINHWKG